MAKKITKPVKVPKPSKTWGVVRFFKSNQFRYALGVFLSIFSGYLAVAFVSYTFSGRVDQSKLDLPWQEFLFDPSVEVQNIAGKGGAYLSEQFINLGFGFSSFFFIKVIMQVRRFMIGQTQQPFINHGQCVGHRTAFFLADLDRHFGFRSPFLGDI